MNSARRDYVREEIEERDGIIDTLQDQVAQLEAWVEEARAVAVEFEDKYEEALADLEDAREVTAHAEAELRTVELDLHDEQAKRGKLEEKLEAVIDIVSAIRYKLANGHFETDADAMNAMHAALERIDTEVLR